MSEQFSKLNKLSHSFASKKPIELAKSFGKKSEIVEGIKPTFSIGKHRDSSDSDSSVSDATENVGIPIHGDFSSQSKVSKNKEAYRPNVGILMGLQTNDVDEIGKEIGQDSQSEFRGSNIQVIYQRKYVVN